MMKKRTLFAILLTISLSNAAISQTAAPKPVGPVPNENQMRWQEMEYYAFVHFSINTFTDQEWGSGGDSPQLFNPDKLDCRQWARVCKEAGMKGIIVTAKHHSGFCLWPSKYTDYSVKNSPWKNGKGDIVRELADACKEYGLKLGIYLSPWDRNYAGYGRPEYITYFRNQLRELLTNYGDIFEIWFDGANGGSGYYGGANETRKIDRTTYYDWKNTYKLIRQLQPKIVIWNDGGDRADLRWVGTESGYVGETNWSLLNATGDVPEDMLRHGVENGNAWVPGEVNTSIRPGWFYHAYEDSRVKTLPQLMNTFYSSAGRNGTLLLNFPIDRHGLIHENDEQAVLGMAKAVKEVFAVDLASRKKAEASNVRAGAKIYAADKAVDGDKNTYWATDEGLTKASLTIDFGKPTLFNRFLAQEYIRLGQRVKSFTLEAYTGNAWQELARETTIGYKRILSFPSVSASRLRLTITDAKASPLISTIAVYQAPQILSAPMIVRDQSGGIRIKATDKESEIFYTLDGSKPGRSSEKYTKELPVTGKVSIRAIAFDPVSGKYSPESTEKFDIVRKTWKILGTDDPASAKIIDGDPETGWLNQKGTAMPADLIIDLGKTERLTGFRYLPVQGQSSGVITRYQIALSDDHLTWRIADEGEFSNIKNNPLWQTKTFKAISGRYLRFRAIQNTQGDAKAGYGEVDVITE